MNNWMKMMEMVNGITEEQLANKMDITTKMDVVSDIKVKENKEVKEVEVVNEEDTKYDIYTFFNGNNKIKGLTAEDVYGVKEQLDKIVEVEEVVEEAVEEETVLLPLGCKSYATGKKAERLERPAYCSNWIS